MMHIDIKIKNDSEWQSQFQNNQFKWNTKNLPDAQTGNIELLDEHNLVQTKIPIQQVSIVYNKKEYKVFMTERDNKTYSVYAIAGEVDRTALLTSIQNNDEVLGKYKSIKVIIQSNKTTIAPFDLKELSPIF